MVELVKLSDVSDDNKYYGILDMLKNVIKRIEDGDIDPNRAIVLALDNRDDRYDVYFGASNISSSQTVALLEHHKHYTLNQMMDT